MRSRADREFTAVLYSESIRDLTALSRPSDTAKLSRHSDGILDAESLQEIRHRETEQWRLR